MTEKSENCSNFPFPDGGVGHLAFGGILFILKMHAIVSRLAFPYETYRAFSPADLETWATRTVRGPAPSSATRRDP